FVPTPLPPPPTSTLFPYTTLFRSAVPRIGLARFNQAAGHGPAAIDKSFLQFGDGFLKKLSKSTHSNTSPAQTRSLKNSSALFLRSEVHTSELQSPCNLVCRLLLEK